MEWEAERAARSTPPNRLPESLAVVATARASNVAHGGTGQHKGERPADYFVQSLALAVSHLRVGDELAQQLRIADSIIARYLRSGWFFAEMVGIVGLFALCFGRAFDGAYFYRIAGLALGSFALFATYVLDHAVALPHLYLRRSLRTLGRPTVAPLVLAATITRVVTFVLLLSLVLIFRRFDSIKPLALVAGAAGLLANCALIAAVAVACSTPFARRGVQLGLLTWLVAALATYSPGTIFSSLPVVPWVLRLPLLPFAMCYDFGVTGTIGWSGAVALVAEAGMIAVAIALADAGLQRRLGGHKPSGAVRWRLVVSSRLALCRPVGVRLRDSRFRRLPRLDEKGNGSGHDPEPLEGEGDQRQEGCCEQTH
ncbi:MAG: hypothetical protein ACXVCX_16170 [Ktedonobacterales bacterium]